MSTLHFQTSLKYQIARLISGMAPGSRARGRSLHSNGDLRQALADRPSNSQARLLLDRCTPHTTIPSAHPEM